MVYNAKESVSSNLSERIEADRAVVKEVLQNLGMENKSENIIKVLRVGRGNTKKARPIKVILSSSQMVKDILKTKSRLYGSDLRISLDLTKIQQEQLRVIKAELKNRQEKGEKNLTIRYINGVPKVEVKSTAKSKNDNQPHC